MYFLYKNSGFIFTYLVGAKIIDPLLIELLNNTAGKENYTIKQTKINQVKVQTNTLDTFRKVTRSLKDKKKIIFANPISTIKYKNYNETKPTYYPN